MSKSSSFESVGPHEDEREWSAYGWVGVVVYEKAEAVVEMESDEE